MECHTGPPGKDSICLGDFLYSCSSFLLSSSALDYHFAQRGEFLIYGFPLMTLAVQLCHSILPKYMYQTNALLNSPRWLLEKGRPLEAQKSLQYLRGYDNNPQAIEVELNEIKDNIELHNATSNHSWRVLFTDRDLFARLWRVALLQFMAQMCGATAMKYYLPTNFIALGLGKQLSLLASGIESSLKVGCTIIESLIIDRVGRRGTLLLGSTIMAIALLVSLSDAYSRADEH